MAASETTTLRVPVALRDEIAELAEQRNSTMLVADLGSRPEDSEQALRRPVVIVSDDRLHHPGLQMVIVVPGTSRIQELPLHVTVAPDPGNGLDRTTDFQLEQVRSISKVRLVEPLGRLDPTARQTIDELLRYVLALR